MNRQFRTDYIGHDRGYKKRQATGKDGWDDEYESRFAILDEWRAKPYVPENGRLLELGCGAGNLSVRLAESGFEVVGVDIAPTAIAWAKERVRGRDLTVEFHQADVALLNQFNAHTFDLVFDSHCLHCIIGDDRRQVLVTAFRLLKPGGVFRIDTMCGDTQREDIAEMLDAASRNVMSGDLATRYLGYPDDIIVEVCDVGFEVIEYRVMEDSVNPDLLLLDCRKPRAD